MNKLESQNQFGTLKNLGECEFVFVRVAPGNEHAPALLLLHQQAKKLGKELIARTLENCTAMPELVLHSLDSLSAAALDELIAITELRIAAASDGALQ
jgi:hypothetical protein